MKSIFISRSLEQNGQFFEYLKNKKATVIDMPLINVVKIPFSYTPQTTWIFFTSKNSMKYFFGQNPSLTTHTKYGVMSSSSESALESYGKRAAFVGQGVDLIKIAKNFRETLGDESVLFPQAMDSLQTMQKHLAFTNTIYNLYTYKTLLKTDFELPYTDVVIFTSPANVRAYFSKYKLDKRQLVVAMGTSTKYMLSEYGIREVLMPIEFSEKGLCEVLVCNNIF